jgi:hypothetical protein
VNKRHSCATVTALKSPLMSSKSFSEGIIKTYPKTKRSGIELLSLMCGDQQLFRRTNSSGYGAERWSRCSRQREQCQRGYNLIHSSYMNIRDSQENFRCFHGTDMRSPKQISQKREQGLPKNEKANVVVSNAS